jgi:hypothetical protein
VFESPFEIVSETLFTKGEKLGTLNRWRQAILEDEAMRTYGVTPERARVLGQIEEAKGIYSTQTLHRRPAPSGRHQPCPFAAAGITKACGNGGLMTNPTEIAVLRTMLRQVNVEYSALVRSAADASKTARLDELRTQRSAQRRASPSWDRPSGICYLGRRRFQWALWWRSFPPRATPTRHLLKARHGGGARGPIMPCCADKLGVKKKKGRSEGDGQVLKVDGCELLLAITACRTSMAVLRRATGMIDSSVGHQPAFASRMGIATRPRMMPFGASSLRLPLWVNRNKGDAALGPSHVSSNHRKPTFTRHIA